VPSPTHHLRREDEGSIKREEEIIRHTSPSHAARSHYTAHCAGTYLPFCLHAHTHVASRYTPYLPTPRPIALARSGSDLNIARTLVAAAFTRTHLPRYLLPSPFLPCPTSVRYVACVSAYHIQGIDTWLRSTRAAAGGSPLPPTWHRALPDPCPIPARARTHRRTRPHTHTLHAACRTPAFRRTPAHTLPPPHPQPPVAMVPALHYRLPAYGRQRAIS